MGTSLRKQYHSGFIFNKRWSSL